MNTAYLTLKTATRLYGKPPAALDGAERLHAERLAKRQFMLEAKVLASAEARDVTVPEATVRAAIAEVQGRYADAQTFYADLAENGLTLEEYTEALRRELNVEAVLEKVASRAARVSDLDVDLYYHFHREEFTRPETRRARHILVTINDHLAENTRAAARARIDAIAARLRKDPGRFEEQAIKHSECPTALQGGLLGEVKRGVLYPALEEALFALPVMALSPVVESDLGFHLLRCDAIRPAGPIPLAEARPKIRAQIESRRRAICQKAWLKSLGSAT